MSKNTRNQRLRTRRDLVSNDKFAAFVRRILCAYARRIAAGDIESLADMARLSDDLETALRQAVTGLRHDHGYSSADLAARLGVTAQAVRKRWWR